MTGNPFRVGKLLVTEEEKAMIIKFMDALVPGVYVKCSECNRLRYATAEIVFTPGGFMCEECLP